MKDKEMNQKADIEKIEDEELKPVSGGNYTPSMSNSIKTSDLVYRPGQTNAEFTTLPVTPGNVQAINLSNSGDSQKTVTGKTSSVKREIL